MTHRYMIIKISDNLEIMGVMRDGLQRQAHWHEIEGDNPVLIYLPEVAFIQNGLYRM